LQTFTSREIPNNINSVLFAVQVLTRGVSPQCGEVVVVGDGDVSPVSSLVVTYYWPLS